MAIVASALVARDALAQPGSGSGSGSGSAGSGSAGPGSAGPGSAGPGSGTGTGSGSGSGSATGPIVIQIPTDEAAPTVSAAASPTVVRLGGKFNVFVRATFGIGVVVNLSEPIQLGSAFEVLRKKSKDSPSGDGRTVREWEIEVNAWELGELMMPGIVVTYTAFGKVGQVQTNAIKLRIEGVLGELVDDPKAMRGNAPPADLIVRDWFWLYVGGGVVIALIVTIAVLLFIRSRRLNRTFLVAGVVATPRRMDSASARALERLMAIEQSGVIERDDDRRSGYAEMVEVIREYLGMRYHVATLDLTSMELVRQLAKVAPGEERELIATWLEGCDLVKYGGLKTTTADAKHTLDDARALIVTTTQIAQAGTKSRPPRSVEPSAPEPTEAIAGAAEPEPEPESTLPMPTEAKPAQKHEDTL